MIDRKFLTCAAATAVLASLGTGLAHGAVLVDTNGFEPGGSPETYAGLQSNGNDGRDLVGQNNWLSFAGTSSIKVTRNRTLTGDQSLRSNTGTRGAARAFTLTPDPAGTDLTVFGTIGNDANDDSGFGDIALTSSTGGFDLLRVRREGGADGFAAFASSDGVNELAGDTVQLGPDGNPTAYEVSLTLRYNVGTDDDQARVQYREIGSTTWLNLSPVASATLDADGFADLGYDLPTGTLYLAVQADNPDFPVSVRIDDLLVSSEVIPEPGSLMLLSLGGVALLGRCRRRTD
ncbi:MAG: PEP-CTERM sorting domain-containing protein [Planctomycetota bacterium]